MKAKIAYLIDENLGWDNEEQDWKFYNEESVPEWKLSSKGIRRIVYFEVE